jgi:hypothetical protein
MVHAIRSSLIVLPLFLLGLAYSLDLPVAWAASEPADVSGVYNCAGTAAEGKEYRGIVVIEKWGDTFHLQWIFPAGLAAIGVGVLNGDALAVTYVAPAVGVILYRLDGQRLLGRWTQPEANGAVFVETLTLIPDAEIRREWRRPRDLRPSHSNRTGVGSEAISVDQAAGAPPLTKS